MRNDAMPCAHTMWRPGRNNLPGRFFLRNAILIAATALTVLPWAPKASADAIRIGLAAPFSGRMGETGHAMEDALRSALEEANAEGGVNGRPLALVTADDACDREMAQASATALVGERAVVAIGHPCSAAAVSAAPIYEKAGRLLVAIGPRHPDVTDAHPAAPILRLAGREDRQGAAAARWLQAHAPGRRVVIVQDRTRYARAIASQAKTALEHAGFENVPVLPIVAGNRDYAKTVEAIRTFEAEAIFFAGFVAEATIVINGLADRGLHIPMLGTDLLASPAFAESVAQSGRSMSVLMPTVPRPRETEMESNLRNPALLAAQARGAFEAWLTTVRRIGTTDARATRRALIETPVRTHALGTMRFDGHGDLVGFDFVSATARRGKWVRDE